MTITDLKQVAAYDATTRRDQRFDGQFYSAVLTTGIFCRPGCPGKPRAENVRFFATAAAAAEAGFRPCLRCHPESAPDPPEWQRTSPVVSRALRLIGQGILNNAGIGELSRRLNVSARQLQRLFVEEHGAPPVAVAQTRRLLFAKKLIDETDLSMADIAFSAGYSSVRRFNEAIRQTYARTPSDLRQKRRRSTTGQDGESIELKLFYREPYNWPAMLAFLSDQATPFVETLDQTTYRRTIRIDGVTGVLSVRPIVNQRALLLRVPSNLSRYLLPITERIKLLFDLKADPVAIDECLMRDPALAPIVQAGPGVRLPGCWDGFEIAVRALVEALEPERGRELIAALVQAYGDDYPGSSDPSLTRIYPTPVQLRDAALADIGFSQPLAEAIRSVAKAVCDGSLSFGGAASLGSLAEQLSATPDIDEDVIQYIAMRILGEPDLDLIGNRLLHRNECGASEADYSPKTGSSGGGQLSWRSYDALYRWNAARSQPLVTS